MGQFISALMDRLVSKEHKRIVFVGLDGAGKTTILYKLQLGEVVHSIPTVGFNVETVTYKNIEMTCWDIGGQKKIRPLWKFYYDNTDAVVFIVDSNDPDRIEEAKEELHGVMANDQLRDAALLVYANKQDLPNAVSCPLLMEKLGLNSGALARRNWHIQGTVAHTGTGLYEGLDWVVGALKDGPRR
jgi:ADP-ribosylation factor 1/2